MRHGEDVVTLASVIRSHPNNRCIVVPHIGSATTETRLGMATMAATNLINGLSGEEMPAELKMSG